MSRLALLLFALLLAALPASNACAQELFLEELTTSQPREFSAANAQFDSSDAAQKERTLNALFESPRDSDWISQTGHSAAAEECSSTRQGCADSCGQNSVTDSWDFSQGLLTFLHEDTGHRYTGFLDFNYYNDTRDFNVLTINAGAKLPYDFEYFQFVNFTSQLGNESALENWTDFFTEIHLRRPIAKDSELFKHLDWTIMWADGGTPREVGRLGIRWRFHDTPGAIGEFFRDTLKLKYALNFHIVEDDGSGWQMEHVYRRSFLDGLVYVGGFADHNVNGTADSSDWVTETQIGVKLLGSFYAVAEYRYFSFANSSRFKQGVGIGVEYAIRFQ